METAILENKEFCFIFLLFAIAEQQYLKQMVGAISYNQHSHNSLEMHAPFVPHIISSASCILYTPLT